MIQKSAIENWHKNWIRRLAQKIQIKNWHKKIQWEIDAKVCQKISVKAKWHKTLNKSLHLVDFKSSEATLSLQLTYEH